VLHSSRHANLDQSKSGATLQGPKQRSRFYVVIWAVIMIHLWTKLDGIYCLALWRETM